MEKSIQLYENEVRLLQSDPTKFEELALEVFRFQSTHNKVYKKFIGLVGIHPGAVKALVDIPFMPISFFKSYAVKTGFWKAERCFNSSGTTRSALSTHYVFSERWYKEVSIQIFEEQIGALDQFQILGFLPTYLENPNSSLIFMVNAFGEQTSGGSSLTPDVKKLLYLLKAARTLSRKIILFSVTYALLQLADKGPIDLSDCLVIETGGMKGLGSELPKIQILEKLKRELNISSLYSEYSMTELMSQAYALDGNYKPGFPMRVMIRQPEIPLGSQLSGRGVLNIVDLANLHSCSFLATDDLGEVFTNGTFNVTGRLDGSDLRGCNLLFAN